MKIFNFDYSYKITTNGPCVNDHLNNCMLSITKCVPLSGLFEILWDQWYEQTSNYTILAYANKLYLHINPATCCGPSLMQYF